MGELILKLLNCKIGCFYGYFFFIAIPFLMLICWVEYKDAEDKRNYKEELLGRFPNQEIYLNLTSEEKYMLESLAYREDLSIDKFLRQAIKEWSDVYEL